MKHKHTALIHVKLVVSVILSMLSLHLPAMGNHYADSTVVVRDYIANMEYVNGVLERVNFEGGYIDMTGESPRYMYYVTDHLGNVRTVVDEDGNVCQVNHYYPYGDRFDDTRDMTVEESDNTKLFGGKEYSEDTSLHDFEARYDNTLFGRFTTLDPFCELTPWSTPYSYCLGDPVNSADPMGLTTYNVNGMFKVIEDGYDETVDVTNREFKKLNRIWNMGLGESYDIRRQGIIDRRGCLDGMGNPVLAASRSSASIYNISDGKMYSLFALAVSTDFAVPEPSDGAILKWGGYALAGVSAVGADYYMAKMNSEIAGIEKRPDGPPGVQYSLRATRDGFYPDIRNGMVFLKVGEVWKYGETTKDPPEMRYGGERNLDAKNLRMYKDFQGTQKQIKVEEKHKLYNYFLTYGHLPPGNAVFR